MSTNGRRELAPGMDAQAIVAFMAEFKANADAIIKSGDELLTAHEDEWVASYAGEFVFGNTLEDVVAAARARDWPMGIVAIEHLSRERAPILL